MRLSKTDFLRYLEAPLHLWASVHGRLETESPTLYQQHLMTQGQQVETLGHQYLEEFLISKQKDAKLFWQTTFDDGQFTIRTDALISNQINDTYHLYEIKSSTSVKTQHLYDLTFQVLLLESRLNLQTINIIHIDKSYLHGRKLNIEQFFIVEEISAKVDKYREDVAIWRQHAWSVAQMDQPPSTLACSKPQSCPCPSLCHPELPENPVYNIPYISKKVRQLQEMGVNAIEDIPESFDLNMTQRKHVEAVKSGRPVIDKQAIQQSLAALQYPYYFLDYETFNPTVPLFPNYHPYEHIVFQYSLFAIKEPGAEPQHFDCLLTGNEDPAPMLVSHLIENLGPQGSVIVWNQSFEANRNKDLAVHCPAYAEQLAGINKRLYDLMLIFRNGHYVHPDFHGSASLKAVLPVLCPELQHKELSISQGEEAMLAWYRLQTATIPPEERIEIETAMKEYCKLDTYGMIAIYNQLCEL